jgi:GntR family transcriptional regulator/MocR family aminotransferase
LAGDLGLSRGTVVEAFAQLSAEGYLEARPGAGTWVADLSAAGEPRRPASAPPERAARFDFRPGVPDLTSFPQAAWMRALRQGLRDLPAASFGYGDPRGRRDLREQLAWYLARARGVRADPELVVVCAGFRHGLSLVARALHLEGARRIAMEDPCAEQHRAVAEAAGLALVPLPVDDRGARTDLLDHTAAGAVLSPAHQFPLGVVLHRERRAQAVSWATATGGVIVEDDYDGEFRYDRQPVGALQALAPDFVAYGGTASKTLAPGLRLAWIVVPPRLLEPIARLRAAEDVHVSALEQVALCQMLRSGAYERQVRRMRACYRARRDRVLEMLERSAPVLAPLGISAGLGLVLELPAGGPGAQQLIEEAARRSIGLHPLAASYAGGKAPRDGIALGYGALPQHEVEAALDALGRLLAEMIPT